MLLETPRVPTLSRGVKRRNESYARHVNSRYSRVGHVFQGRFNGVIVEKESHLLELTRYIVLNPVRCGAVVHADDWKWSNYRATAGLAPAPAWLEVDWTLAQFDERSRAAACEKYRRFVADGRGATYNPWEDLVGQIYLGGAAFCERIQQLIDEKPRAREYPRDQRRPVLPAFDEVVASVATVFCAGSVEALKRPSRGPARKAFAHLAWAEGDVAMTAIGEWLDVTPGAISKLVRSSERLELVDEEYRAGLGIVREAIRRPGESCVDAPDQADRS